MTAPPQDADLRTGTWVTFVSGRASARCVRRCRLTVTQGPDLGKVFEFAADTIRIGARRAADVVLTDSKVSGLHAEILLSDDGYRLRDLASRNGTSLSGVRIYDAELAPHTLIAVGQSRLRFDPLSDAVAVPLADANGFGPLIGSSPAMRAVYAELERLAPLSSPVLIRGETGTGKSLAALALHEASARRDGPLIVVDCRTLAAEVGDAELFGDVSPWHARTGLIERAHTGTLLLAEIADLPLALQPKLMRLLDFQEVRPLGDAASRAVDVRIIATTQRDLAIETNRGRFREDLYFRLGEATVTMPPLRARKDDLPDLVAALLQQLPTPTPLAESTMARLVAHDWPGNVRELRNVLDHALLSPSETDGAPSAPATAPPEPASVPRVDLTVPFKIAKQRLIDEFEQRYIQDLLASHAGNVSSAARAAGIDRMSVHKILQRVGRQRG